MASRKIRENTLNQDEGRTCFNCRFFVKHYTNRDGYFCVVKGCGHCINRNNFSHKKWRVSNVSCCEFWESDKILIDERRIKITETLLSMAQRLEEISQILKEDNGD